MALRVFAAVDRATASRRPGIAVGCHLGTNLGYRHYAHNLHRFYNCDWIIGPGGPALTSATGRRDGGTR